MTAMLFSWRGCVDLLIAMRLSYSHARRRALTFCLCWCLRHGTVGVDLNVIANNAGVAAATAPVPAPAPAPASALTDLSDPEDATQWVDKCAKVFPVRCTFCFILSYWLGLGCLAYGYPSCNPQTSSAFMCNPLPPSAVATIIAHAQTEMQPLLVGTINNLICCLAPIRTGTRRTCIRSGQQGGP